MNEDAQGLSGSTQEQEASVIAAASEIAVVAQPTPEHNRNTEEAPEVSEEEKEISHTLESFERFPKLKKWAELFTNKDNKATYGNRTESAMQAYNCKSRPIAGNIGSQNYKKLHGVASLFAEDRGVTVTSMLEVLAARALSSESAEWWKLAASVFGIHDPKVPQLLVQNNTQINASLSVDNPEVIDFNASFKRFLEQE